VTFAVTVNAYNTPDAISEIQNSMRNRHLETKLSPLSNRNRVYLGDTRPLDDFKTRCELRNAEAIRELQDTVDDLEREWQLLRESRRKLVNREVITCIYLALGHDMNNPRSTTFEYIQQHPNILQESLGLLPEEISAVLDTLDPRPNQSWIKTGNEAAHEFSLAEANHLINDPTIRMLLNALSRYAGDEYTSIQDASFVAHNDLVSRVPALTAISNLPHPSHNNSTIASEVVRVVGEHLRNYFPSFPTYTQGTSLPFPPPPPFQGGSNILPARPRSPAKLGPNIPPWRY